MNAEIEALRKQLQKAAGDLVGARMTAYAAEHKVSAVDALDAVLKADPKLKEQYLGLYTDN